VDRRELQHAIDGAETAGRWLIFLIHTIAPTAAIWYAPIDVSVITDSVAHAKSLGDVWIDSTVNVGAYWRGAEDLSRRRRDVGRRPDLDLDAAAHFRRADTCASPSTAARCRRTARR
jgi:hypothetical protein